MTTNRGGGFFCKPSASNTSRISAPLLIIMICCALILVVTEMVHSDKFIFNQYGDMNNFSGKIVQLTFPYIYNSTTTYYLSKTEKKAFTDCNEYRVGSYRTSRNAWCGDCKVLSDVEVGDHATVSTLTPSLYPLCYIESGGNQTNYRVVAINFSSQLQATVASATPYCVESCGEKCCNSNSVVGTISLK